jgi:hypothetical protein
MQKLVLSSILAATLAFVLGFPAEAQQPKTVFRIGYLSSSDPVTDRRIEGIRQSLRELGYIASLAI